MAPLDFRSSTVTKDTLHIVITNAALQHGSARVQEMIDSFLEVATEAGVTFLGRSAMQQKVEQVRQYLNDSA